MPTAPSSTDPGPTDAVTLDAVPTDALPDLLPAPSDALPTEAGPADAVPSSPVSNAPVPSAPVTSTVTSGPGAASRTPIPSVRAVGGVPPVGPTPPAWHPAEVRRALEDTRHLVRFWRGTIRNPRAVRIALVVLTLITLTVILGPLAATGAGTSAEAEKVRDLLPTILVGFLALNVAAGLATGGGRELLSQENGTAFPTSATTDHFGALLLAPLSLAWMVQAWTLLGASAFALGPGAFPGMLLVLLGWILTCTVVAQAVAWGVETVRRGPGGVWIVRAVGAALALAALVLHRADRLVDLLDADFARLLLDFGTAGGHGFTWRLPVLLAVLLAVSAVALFLGGCGANAAARRPVGDAVKLESRHHRPRRTPGPGSERAVTRMLLRIDRASVWRAAPTRRGVLVLALGPGVVALLGGLTWDNVVILPGLVVSGGALLFGVNAFSLDGRGGLWRESLPVDAGRVFDARARVMGEWLLAASLVTLALAAVRAGTPTSAEVAAVTCTVVVVTLQVVAVAMSWSVRRPYAVNLRSVRATPAPPPVMVGYSAKLALSTTLTATVFSSASWVVPALGGPAWVVLVLACPFLAWSAARLLRARRVWTDSAARAKVVTTVAA